MQPARMKPHRNSNSNLDRDDEIPDTSATDRRKIGSTSPPDSSAIKAIDLAPRISGNPQDIICGRGLHIMSHLGNIKLHSVVNRYRPAYQVASRREKADMAQRIVNEIKSSGSRFIRRAGSGKDDEWVEVDNETAYKKVGHALRLRKSLPLQISSLVGSQQEMPERHELNLGPSAGAVSTTLPLHQPVVGMTVAVPQNGVAIHPSMLSALSVPNPWHPFLRNQLLQPMVGLQPGIIHRQPQMIPPVVNNGHYGQLLANNVFASVFQSTLSALTQSTYQQAQQVQQGRMPNHQGVDNTTVGPRQESKSKSTDEVE